MTLLVIVALAAVLFAGYALLRHYSETPVGEPVQKRLLLAFSAAAAAIAAAVMSWLHAGAAS